MSDGVATWFSHQRPDLLDPGPGNLLVTADPLWNDTKALGKVPANCAGQFSAFSLDPRMHRQLRCVIEPGKDCHREWSSGPMHEGCDAGSNGCDRGEDVR
jgi:hypothetical protein